MSFRRSLAAVLACASLLGACAGERKCEVKLMLRSDLARVQESFGLDHESASRRTQWFFDTPALALAGAGVVLRARERAGEPDDATVKLRPMDDDQVAPAWRALAGFKCETDLAGEHAEPACSLDAKTPPGAIDSVARRTLPAAALFDSDQRRFLAEYASIAIPWDELAPLGPVDVRVWNFHASDWKGKLSLELWRLPGGLELLELSTRVPEHDAESTRTALIDYLRRRALEPSEEQATKTRATLEALAGS